MRTACAGVMMRRWSSEAEPDAGRIPGVRHIRPGQRDLMASTSWPEQTTPSSPHAWAARREIGGKAGKVLSVTGQFAGGHAGEHGHREEQGLGAAFLGALPDRIDGGIDHAFPAERVEGDQVDAHEAGRTHAARDRVRDVEHLEVEHDLEAHILELLDDGGAFVGEEFKADLHPGLAQPPQGFGGGEGVFGVGIVEGYNELRHEFILPEWCCQPRAVCGVERRGKVDRAQLVIGLVQIVVDDPSIEPVGLADFGGGVGQAAGDARLVVRAAPAQPAFQFAQGRRQEKDVLPARERRCSWAAP